MDASGPIWGSIVLQLVFLIIHAVIAACDAAFPALSENKVRQLCEEDERMSHLLARYSSERLSMCLEAAERFSGIWCAAFGTAWLILPMCKILTSGGALNDQPQLVQIAGVLVGAFVLTLILLTLCGWLPRQLVRRNPERSMKALAGILNVFCACLTPLVCLSNAFTAVLRKLLRIAPEKVEEQVTEEEIRMMVDIGEEKGAIESQEAELIDNIFEFNNQAAGDVMVHRIDITALSAESSDDEIIETILETGFSRFPVYGEDIDDIVGMLNTREYLLNKQAEQPKTLRELIHPAYLIPETVHADVLFRDMQKNKIHMAVVVDEYGGTSGLVTMEDLLEEIVGDIYDEFDQQQEQDIIRLEDNKWRVRGSVDLETLSEAIGVELPLEEEFDTLGGLVYSRLTTIPEDGATPCVEAFGLHIQVEKLEDRRVESAVVTRIQEEE